MSMSSSSSNGYSSCDNAWSYFTNILGTTQKKGNNYLSERFMNNDCDFSKDQSMNSDPLCRKAYLQKKGIEFFTEEASQEPTLNRQITMIPNLTVAESAALTDSSSPSDNTLPAVTIPSPSSNLDENVVSTEYDMKSILNKTRTKYFDILKYYNDMSSESDNFMLEVQKMLPSTYNNYLFTEDRLKASITPFLNSMRATFSLYVYMARVKKSYDEIKLFINELVQYPQGPVNVRAEILKNTIDSLNIIVNNTKTQISSSQNNASNNLKESKSAGMMNTPLLNNVPRLYEIIDTLEKATYMINKTISEMETVSQKIDKDVEIIDGGMFNNTNVTNLSSIQIMLSSKNISLEEMYDFKERIETFVTSLQLYYNKVKKPTDPEIYNLSKSFVVTPSELQAIALGLVFVTITEQMALFANDDKDLMKKAYDTIQTSLQSLTSDNKYLCNDGSVGTFNRPCLDSLYPIKSTELRRLWGAYQNMLPTLEPKSGKAGYDLRGTIEVPLRRVPVTYSVTQVV